LQTGSIDGLKKINDTYGHQEGSAALIECAKILQKTFRDSDIIARLGGDEFTVLIINAADQVNEMIAERLQQNLAEHNAQSGKTYELAVSFGLVAITFDGHDSVEEIMREADRRMYEHKRSRKMMRI